MSNHGPIVWIAGTNWDGVAGTDKRMVESLARFRPVLWVDPPTRATLKTVARLRGRPDRPAARTGQPDWNGYPIRFCGSE